MFGGFPARGVLLFTSTVNESLPMRTATFLSFALSFTPRALALGILSLGAGIACAQQLAEIESPDNATPMPAATEQHAQVLAARESYLRTIAELEAQHGTYGVELSEAYVGLGTTLRALGEPDAAVAAFDKALQAVRVGYGLNDLRQLPVLRELRTTQEIRQDWEAVHSANYLIFHIAARAGDASLRVNSLRELGRWIRRANAERLVSSFDANVGDLLTLFDNEIARLEALPDYPGRNLHLASLYLDMATTELAEAKRKYELPISDFQMPGLGENPTTTTQTCFSGVDRSGRPITVCNAPVVIPNMNYYLGPNAQKDQEIRAHLVDVEQTVLKAFHNLEAGTDASAEEAELRAEMQRLAGEFNAFVEENRDQSTPLR